MKRNGLKMVAVAGVALALGHAGFAQFNPVQGDWGKDELTDLRVMTWNVLDGVRSTISKGEGGQWDAIARIIAVVKPDVLVMQECGDSEALSTLVTTCELLIHGGADPFLGGTVGSYVQEYAPTFDLPYTYVNSETDGFNRNLIMSRYPFIDLNGDGKSTYPDIAFVTSTGTYAAGGDGGIRGYGFAEIDLPDDIYEGDLVQGFAHLKAGGTASDLLQRLNASKNVAYYIDHFYNGGGMGTVDPFGKISDFPEATSILDEHTVIVLGGDWNEDESTNGRKGPAEWLTLAEFAAGTDGTDYDRTDSTYDTATDALDGSTKTWGSSSKLDYIAWQDSKATPRHQVVFDSLPMNTSSRPDEFLGVTRYRDLSGDASDHLPVFVDLMLALVPPPPECDGDTNSDGVVDLTDLSNVLFNFGASVPPGTGADVAGNDGVVDLNDLSTVLFNFGCGT
jgi:hypothetical protein